jgi:aminobenzoyl-glutamate transport protein
MKSRNGNRLLDWVEHVGNRMPDPAIHFLIALSVVWILSAALSPIDFGVADPRTGQPLRVVNQLTPAAVTSTLQNVVSSYTGFPPLGVILVLALGVGVAEHSGLLGAGLHRLLAVAPKSLLTPMVAVATILAGLTSDAALLVMAPLGGAAFYAAGRHPVAGVLAGYWSNMMLIAAFLPNGFDVVLQGFTEKAAQILAPARVVNPLCNWTFTATAAVLTTLGCWFVIDRIVEPRLAGTPVDGDPANLPQVRTPCTREDRALRWAVCAAIAVLGLIAAAAAPSSSPFRGPDGTLTGTGAPLMKSIVPLALILTVLPGMVYGLVSGSMTSHRDVIRAMSKNVSSMGYYMVLVFFASQFIRGFSESNLGALIAIKGGIALKAMALPPLLTLAGLIGLTSLVDLVVASASAKWAMLAPIFVPMLMTAGISPEITQLAYRIGDSPTNILTPLSPYFPLVIAFCARYVRGTGIGTIISLSIPFAAVCMAAYVLELGLFWTFGVPFGIQAPRLYP